MIVSVVRRPRSAHGNGAAALSVVAFVALAALGGAAQASAADKPRLVVLTDIGGDPDDTMSMVRLMTYANQVDIEGLVATPTGPKDEVNPQRIQNVVAAYGKVRDNLELHEPGYPAAEHLLSCIAPGLQADGMNGVGEGRDSPGSELLIRVVDRADPRPVWVAVWGGPNVLAQALFKVRSTRPADAVARFVAKLRVHAISDQDDSGPWIRKEFPGLFYIVTPGVNAGGGFHHATWIAIGGDKFHGRSRTSSRRGWTGPSSRTGRPTTRRFPGSITPSG